VVDDGDHRLDLRRLLGAVEAAQPLDAVEVLGRELARMVDATSVALLIANFSGDGLVRLVHVSDPDALRDGRNERVESLELQGSVHERVLWSQELHVARASSGCEVLVPVTERGDAIGILELHLPYHPGNDIVEYLESAAHALAYVLIASRRHTDLFEWAQRDKAFSLAAEIQRRLLPPSYSVEVDAFTLAGWLEPASDVGGDTFDYSLDREFLYGSITDAMGHATPAALLATLTVGSLRNTRRQLASPAEQADRANAELLKSGDGDQFVTGLLFRIRLADGRLELVNAGHPPPFLLRDGVAGVLVLGADPALGIVDGSYATHVHHLRPGDRLLLVTDGFLERNATTIDIKATLEATSERHPREIVRELASNVLDASSQGLRDDATVLCVDWHGSHGERMATAGASRERATTT
jgi:serine phosphatase RsbU (regulator of sigma subunit)